MTGRLSHRRVWPIADPSDEPAQVNRPGIYVSARLAPRASSS